MVNSFPTQSTRASCCGSGAGRNMSVASTSPIPTPARGRLLALGIHCYASVDGAAAALSYAARNALGTSRSMSGSSSTRDHRRAASRRCRRAQHPAGGHQVSRSEALLRPPAAAPGSRAFIRLGGALPALGKRLQTVAGNCRGLAFPSLPLPNAPAIGYFCRAQSIRFREPPFRSTPGLTTNAGDPYQFAPRRWH